MSKLHEAKRLKADVIRLAQTSPKGLKKSDISALFESIDDYRVQLSTLLSEDATLVEMGRDISRRLDEFQKRLDEDEAPPAPTPPTPPAPTAEEEEGDPDACGEACTTLLDAAELLRDAAEGGAGDPDAALQVAEELEGIADTMKGGDVEVTDEEPFTDIDGDPDNLTLESAKKVIARFQRRNKILENRNNRLIGATNKLLESHNKLRKKSTQLGESGSYKEAAEQLAAKYNNDMCEMGRSLFALKQPELYEANKAKLDECANWKKMVALTESLVKSKTAPPAKTVESSPPAPQTEEAKKLAEAEAQKLKEAEEKKKLEESADSVTNHGAIQMLKRVRR